MGPHVAPTYNPQQDIMNKLEEYKQKQIKSIVEAAIEKLQTEGKSINIKAIMRITNLSRYNINKYFTELMK
jgi:hypothetical protein